MNKKVLILGGPAPATNIGQAIVHANSPNKLFDSLSAGKPIIVNSAGWTKDLVEKNNCGGYVNPNEPEELKEMIKAFQANPKYMKTMSENARKLAENTFDKSILCQQFTQVINKFNPKV